MKKILFLKDEKSYLPEVDSYVNYFNKDKNFEATVINKKPDSNVLSNFDVFWEFKGIGGIKSDNVFTIHEYASLSTGKFPKIKNKIKKTINPKPNLRIFLNRKIQTEFSFEDDIQFIYRDMGINEIFLQNQPEFKEFEFVYTGSLHSDRNIRDMLDSIVKNNFGKICLIGTPPDDLYNSFKKNNDIIFTGKVDYNEVPKIASKAEYGLNYIPNSYPFNIQTSTKLLEYLALGLKIISTDYYWVNKFEKDNNCNFFKISQRDFSLKGLKEFDFQNNMNMEKFLWNNIFDETKIKDIILNN